jgi:hypothetical protein
VHIRDGKSKDVSILAEHEGYWYIDCPAPHYPLNQSNDWGLVESIYVCREEAYAEAVTELGLAATTCLGGRHKSRLSDWPPVNVKHVEIDLK